MGCVHAQLNRERCCQRMGKSQGPLTVLASPCEHQPASTLPELFIRISSTISAFTPWPRPVKISTHDAVSIMVRQTSHVLSGSSGESRPRDPTDLYVTVFSYTALAVLVIR